MSQFQFNPDGAELPDGDVDPELARRKCDALLKASSAARANGRHEEASNLLGEFDVWSEWLCSTDYEFLMLNYPAQKDEETT